MKNICFSLVVLCCSLACNAQPAIVGFTPSSAPVGSTITISGTGFNTTAAQNLVYFGNVQGNVISSTATTIQVTVPGGAEYKPLSVTTNGLTAFSARPFLLSFPGGGIFTPDVFSQPDSLVNIYKPCIADFDNDGNMDIAGATYTGYVRIFRNTGTLADFSFTQVTLPFSFNYTSHIEAADLNGDGKPELIISQVSNTRLNIFKNTSTPGNISFDAVAFSFDFVSDFPVNMTTTDLDGDGKVDVMVSLQNSGHFTVLPNTSTGGNLSFGTKRQFNYSSGGATEKLFISDIDGDNKPDVTVSSNYFTPLLVFRNTSVPGTINFASNVIIPSGRTGSASGSSGQSLSLGDIDGDGKPDMVLTYPNSDSFFIFRNTSSASLISFAPRLEYKTPGQPIDVVVNDYDGDAKPDIAILEYNDSAIVYKNTSNPGTILLGGSNAYPATYIDQTGGMIAGDIDADGKTDLLASSYSTNSGGMAKLKVLRNQAAGPVITSAIPYTASQGQTVTLRGRRFSNVSEVSFGNIPASSFSVLSDSVITAVIGVGASGNITIRSANGIFKFPGFTFTLSIPAIDSITPGSGNVGSTVTIHGKNFSTVPGENIVHFGSGRASVISATSISLSVVVPAYSSFAAVSVTKPAGAVTGYSPAPFNITFQGSPNAFVNSSFEDTVMYPSTETVSSICPADFDGDLKSDFAVSEANADIQLSVFKNQSFTGNVSFAPRLIYQVSVGTTESGGRPLYATTADINGDGLQDMITSSGTRDTMSVLLSTSTPGTLSFAPKKDFLTGDEPNRVNFADFDLDGKPDIIVSTGAVKTISVYKNISTATTAFFQPRIDFTVPGTWLYDAIAFDVDGDYKPEIVAPVNSTNELEILPNTSTPGSISFANPVFRPAGTTGTSTSHLFNADLDGDGKQDLVEAISGGFSLFRNTSTPGNIAFASRIDSTLAFTDYTITDINGDGKPDLIFCNEFTNLIYIYPNQSVPGTFSFGARVDINKSLSPYKINAADVTGDGKPDLICYYPNYRVIVLKNKFGDTATTLACPSLVNTTIRSNITGTSYQWQVNSGSGYVNLANGINYNAVNTQSLSLINLPSSNYGNLYRCVVNGNNSDVTFLKIQDKWTGVVSNAWENPANWSCGTVPDSFTDVIINSGSVVINSNVSVHSIIINNPATLAVNPGFNLLVAH